MTPDHPLNELVQYGHSTDPARLVFRLGKWPCDEITSIGAASRRGTKRDFKDARRQNMQATLELEAKALNYLLVANGAGLAGCVATLKG